MKKIYFIFIGLLILLSPYSGFSQADFDYGEYLISKNKSKISMDLENVAMVDLLKALSQQSKLNFISTEAVRERKITLYVENAPLKEAIDIIFKANNLIYEYFPGANMFIVKEMGKPSIELKTKVYKLKYVRVENSRIQKEVNELIAGEESDSEDDDEDEGLLEGIKKVLSEYGKVVSEPITNSLIVVDVPAQFPLIDEVIKTLDVSQPKVLIEVEMLDVSKSIIDNIGFKWGTTDNPGFSGSFTGGSYDTVFPFPKRFLNSIDWTSTPDRTLTLGTLDFSTFNVLMGFLTRDNSTRFLARPKILTLSNETSEVNLTTDEAIGLTTTVTSDGVITQEVERTETGTKLRVTPQVNSITGDITMVVEVFNKSATESDFELSGSTSGKIMNPESRGTTSVLRMKSGETLLIGGLIRDINNESVSKVPFLGDIPLMGKLFTQKTKNNEERELLIFLTPKIIQENMQLTSVAASMEPREQSMISSRQSAIDNMLNSLSDQ